MQENLSFQKSKMKKAIQIVQEIFQESWKLKGKDAEDHKETMQVRVRGLCRAVTQAEKKGREGRFHRSRVASEAPVAERCRRSRVA